MKNRLYNNEYDKIAFYNVLHENGIVVFRQLLNNDFRKNLSSRECEKMLDISLDNLCNSVFMQRSLFLHLRNMTGFEEFFIDPNTREIIEEKK